MDKFKEFLKSLGYTDEQITKIAEGMKEQKIYLSQEENIDERYTKLKGQYDTQKTELKTANDTIEELKKSNTGNEDLQTKVADYEKEIQKLKEDSEKQLFEKDLDLILTGANVHSLKAAKALLDMEKVKRKDDGTIEGVTDQIETWKKESPWLIKTGEKQTEYNPASGGDPGTKSTASTIAATKNQTTTNSYANAWA